MSETTDIVVGDKAGSNQTLTIPVGTMQTNGSAIIGNEATAVGKVVVAGPGTVWALTSSALPLTVGRYGTGTLEISAGAKVTSAGTSIIGDQSGANGTLNVFAAGVLTTDKLQLGDFSIDANALSNGVLNIDGAGSAVHVSGSASNVGLGTINVTNGGLLETATAQNHSDTTRIYSSTGQGNTVNVNGVGSRFVMHTDFELGAGRGIGTGTADTTLNIGAGALVSTAQNALIGDVSAIATNMSYANVMGKGSRWDVGNDLTIGGNTTGNLTIADGAQVTSHRTSVNHGSVNLNGTPTAQGALTTGKLSKFSSDSSGQITFDGGLLRASAYAPDFISDFTPGQLDISTGGATIDSNGHYIGTDNMFTGVGALTKTGAGTLALTADNLYAGGTVISAGRLQLGNQGITGSVTGDIVDNAALVIKRLDAVALNGTISGTGSVAQAGSGITTFTGSNSYTGTTQVATGTLLVNGNQTTATGLTTVASGATLGGNGTLGGNVLVQNGGTLAPGASVGTAGTLTTGSLTLSPTSVLAVDLGRAGAVGGRFNDLVKVTGDLVLGGTVNVTEPEGGTFGAGVYRLIDYTGTGPSSATSQTLAIGTLPAGQQARNMSVQTAVDKQVNLINVSPAGNSFWNVSTQAGTGGPSGGTGIWQANGGNSNWTSASGAGNTPFANGSFAIFQGTPGTVTVDNGAATGGQVLTNGMQFAVDGYRVNGGPLTTTGAPMRIRVGAGGETGAGMTATVDAVIQGAGSIEKTDAGTLVLSGVNTYTGGTTVSAGTLRVSQDWNLGAAAGGLTLNGGTLQLGVAFNSAFSTSRSVTLGPAGALSTSKKVPPHSMAS